MSNYAERKIETYQRDTNSLYDEILEQWDRPEAVRSNARPRESSPMSYHDLYLAYRSQYEPNLPQPPFYRTDQYQKAPLVGMQPYKDIRIEAVGSTHLTEGDVMDTLSLYLLQLSLSFHLVAFSPLSQHWKEIQLPMMEDFKAFRAKYTSEGIMKDAPITVLDIPSSYGQLLIPKYGNPRSGPGSSLFPRDERGLSLRINPILSLAFHKMAIFSRPDDLLATLYGQTTLKSYKVNTPKKPAPPRLTVKVNEPSQTPTMKAISQLTLLSQRYPLLDRPSYLHPIMPRGSDALLAPEKYEGVVMWLDKVFKTAPLGFTKKADAKEAAALLALEYFNAHPEVIQEAMVKVVTAAKEAGKPIPRPFAFVMPDPGMSRRDDGPDRAPMTEGFDELTMDGPGPIESTRSSKESGPSEASRHPPSKRSLPEEPYERIKPQEHSIRRLEGPSTLPASRSSSQPPQLPIHSTRSRHAAVPRQEDAYFAPRPPSTFRTSSVPPPAVHPEPRRTSPRKAAAPATNYGLPDHIRLVSVIQPVSYTHLTLPTIA